jgi:hypothetical protein
MFGPQEDGTACELGTTSGTCTNGTCSSGESAPIETTADTLNQPLDTIAPDVTTEPSKPQPSGCTAGATSSSAAWLLLLLTLALSCWRKAPPRQSHL